MRKSYFLLALLLVGCAPASTADFKTYSSEEFGLSIDSPYPIDFKATGDQGAGGLALRTLEGRATNPLPKYLDIAQFIYSYLTKNKPRMDMYQMSLHASRSYGKKNYDSNSILGIVLHNLAAVQRKGISDFQHKETPLQVGSMPATLVTGSFKIEKKEFSTFLYFQNLIVVHEKQYWRLYCAYQDGEKYDEMTKKIIQSVKITPK